MGISYFETNVWCKSQCDSDAGIDAVNLLNLLTIWWCMFPIYLCKINKNPAADDFENIKAK